jgi:hypothetical protein
MVGFDFSRDWLNALVDLCHPMVPLVTLLSCAQCEANLASVAITQIDNSL